MKKYSGNGNGKQGQKGNGKPGEVRKDRKSGTGMNGSPKKGGRGGKFTWAGDVAYSPAEMGLQKEVFDEKDPNFEDPEEITTV
ncbi:hypothetical protein EV1_026173 [Malus domestica]